MLLSGPPCSAQHWSRPAVSAARADDLEGFGGALAKTLRSEGLSLIELVL